MAQASCARIILYCNLYIYNDYKVKDKTVILTIGKRPFSHKTTAAVFFIICISIV